MVQLRKHWLCRMTLRHWIHEDLLQRLTGFFIFYKCPYEASHERNPDKEPYRSPSDERLKVLLCCEIVNINVNIPVWCFNFFLILVARK